MRIRVFLVACASLPVLAFAAPALATYTKPRLVVNEFSYAKGAATTVEFIADTSKSEDATQNVTIYVAQGYKFTLGQAPGSPIGDLFGTVLRRATGSGNLVRLTGSVNVGNATDWVTQATLCTGTPTHQAFWVMNGTFAGNALQIPIFFDTITTGPEAAFASAKLQVCFQSPYVPAAAGGTPAGAQLVTTLFSIAPVFKNPGTSGLTRWPSLFTPFSPGTANANAGGTVESRAVVPVGSSLTLASKNVGSGVQLFGRLRVSGKPLPNGPVDLYSGPKPSNVAKFVGTRKSKKNGSYRFNRRRAKKKTFFQAVFGPLDVKAAGFCATPRAPGGCVSATLSEVDSRIVKVPARR